MPANAIAEHRSLFKIVSILLLYPQEDLIGSIPELGSAIGSLQELPGKSACAVFLSYLQSKPLIRLQEEYTRTFDLNPPTSLNLTFHQLGDSKERGNALAGLIKVYRTAGYETSTGELPDYLPMILEFLSVCPSEYGERILTNFQDSILLVTDRLRSMDSPYVGLLEALPAVGSVPWGGLSSPPAGIPRGTRDYPTTPPGVHGEQPGKED